MKLGVTTSVVFHALAVSLGVVSLSTPKALNVQEVEALPVDIIPIEALTKAVQGDKKADPSKEPAPKPTTRPETVENAENIGDTERDTKADAPKETKQPAVEKTEAPSEQPKPAEVAKPTPVPTPQVAPEPEPKTDIAKLVEDAPEPDVEKPVEETFEAPKRVTAPKARPTKPKPDTAQTNKRKDEKKVAKKPEKKSDKKKKNDKIAALLNKEDPSAGGAKRSKKKAALGTKKGKAVKLAQSELDALRAHISNCWSVGALAGSVNADKLRARAAFNVDRNGELDGRPDVKASGGDKRENRTLSGAVRRAISRCKEFPMLKDKYDTGEEIVVNFSLKDML